MKKAQNYVSRDFLILNFWLCLILNWLAAPRSHMIWKIVAAGVSLQIVVPQKWIDKLI